MESSLVFVVATLDPSQFPMAKGRISVEWFAVKKSRDSLLWIVVFFLLLFILMLFSRWWFQTFLMFTPILGEMIQFDEYFSNGLKPPTSFGWGRTQENKHRSQVNRLAISIGALKPHGCCEGLKGDYIPGLLHMLRNVFVHKHKYFF